MLPLTTAGHMTQQLAHTRFSSDVAKCVSERVHCVKIIVFSLWVRVNLWSEVRVKDRPVSTGLVVNMSSCCEFEEGEGL